MPDKHQQNRYPCVGTQERRCSCRVEFAAAFVSWIGFSECTENCIFPLHKQKQRRFEVHLDSLQKRNHYQGIFDTVGTSFEKHVQHHLLRVQTWAAQSMSSASKRFLWSLCSVNAARSSRHGTKSAWTASNAPWLCVDMLSLETESPERRSRMGLCSFC